jgi:hypothetical protein
VTCHTQPCRPCAGTHILHYLPQGVESSPRGSWGICAPALPEVLTSGLQPLFWLTESIRLRELHCKTRSPFYYAILMEEDGPVPLPFSKSPTTSRRSTPKILGDGLADKIFSFHTYRRRARSHISQETKVHPHRHIGGNSGTVEYGRRRANRSSEDISTRYQEWTIEDIVYITLLCM